MIYYINLVFLYSLLGFILESVVYKISNTNQHSSIFYGPYTLVYGFGMLFCIIIYDKLNIILYNNILTYIVYYIIFMIITTTTEFIGGHTIHYFLKIDKWNYTNHKYHFGKYICLDYAIYWGLLSLFIILKIQPFLNNFILINIPTNTTYLILLIFLTDFTIVIKNKIMKNF